MHAHANRTPVMRRDADRTRLAQFEGNMCNVVLCRHDGLCADMGLLDWNLACETPRNAGRLACDLD